MTQPPVLLTAAQVATATGVSLTTVKRKAKAGSLPYAMKVPGKTGAYLFDKATIETLRVAS